MKTTLIAALIFVGSLRAEAAYDSLGAGARAPAMGDAVVALADDVYTIYYNPAGLGTLERPQFGTSYTKLFVGLKDGSDINTMFVGYAQPLREGRQGTLATAWNSFSLNNTLYRENSFYLSYGRLFYSSPQNGDLYAGVSAKYLSTSFGTFAEATNAVGTNSFLRTGQADPGLARSGGRGVFDADIGLLYRLGKHYGVGFQAVHVPQPNVALTAGQKDRLPVAYKLGINYRSLISNLLAQVDTQKTASGLRNQVFTVAAERWFPRLFVGDFGLRGGFGLGSRDYRNLTLGLSYRTRRVQLDYGFALPINNVDATAGVHRAAITFRFGKITEEEESLEMVLEAMRQLKYGALPTRKQETKELSASQQRTVEEYLTQAHALEASAQYKDALDKFSQALTAAPADKELIAQYGRLNFVGQQITRLPQYKSDPMQATLHQGLISYLGGDDFEAVQKVSEALSLKPSYHELEVFLSQLELVTGIKRGKVAAKAPAEYNTSVTLTRANSAIQDGKYNEAIELSLAVIRQDAQNASAWQNLGTAYFALRDYESSYSAWQRAYDMENSPAVREAIKGYLKSVFRAMQQKPSKKVKAKPEARPLPSRPSLSIEEIQKLFNDGVDAYTRREFDKAKKIFEEILQADPENVEAQKALRRVREEVP